MPDTRIIYVEVLILVPLIYAASKNIAVISRIAQIIMYITVIFFLISFFGVIQFTQIDNVLPFLANGPMPPIISAIIYALFSTAPLFLLTIINKNQMSDKGNKSKKIIIMYILSSLLIFGVIIGTTMVLGYDVISLYKYPEYMALKNFSLFNIIERVENTLAIQFIFDMFIFMLMSFYFTITSIKKVIKNGKVEKIAPYILGFILLMTTIVFFKNQIQIIEFYVGVVIPLLISILVIMLIIGIFLFFKTKKLKKLSTK